MNGALHNDISKSVKEATLKEIEASINWYKERLLWFEDPNGKYPHFKMPHGWLDNLEILKAERTNRIGK